MPILQIIRAPGIFTAIADVLAGYFILRFAGAGEGRLTMLLFLLGSSACLYAAGMAWNDIFDLEEDRLHRPERPLPSGHVSLTTAFLLASILSVSGVMFAMAVGLRSFLIAFAILLLALLYDAGLKRIELLGPLAMAGCRGLNLLLGMTVFAQPEPYWAAPWVMLAPLVLTGYVLMLTVISRLEDDVPAASAPVQDAEEETQVDTVVAVARAMPTAESMPAPVTAEDAPIRTLTLLFAGVGLVAIPLWSIALLPVSLLSIGMFVLLLLMLLVPLLGGQASADPASLRRLVGASIAGIPVLDAALVASAAAGSVGLPLLRVPGVVEVAAVCLIACMAVFMSLGRRICAVT